MKQDFLIEGVHQWIGGDSEVNWYNNRRNGGNEGAYCVELYAADDADDYEAVCDDYNEHADAEVLRLAVISQRQGEYGWHLEEGFWEKPDALEDPSLYGAADNNGIRVIGRDKLNDEEEFLVERAREADGEEYAELIKERFAEIRAEMNDRKVLVYDIEGDLDQPSNYEVRTRYPMEWEKGGTRYLLVLRVTDEYDEDDIESLDDLAEYLNVSLHTLEEDYPCFVEEVCKEKGWRYIPGMEPMEWATDGEETLCVEDGKFAVK